MLPGPLIAGMLGAIAIASVNASRQAEGGGAGAACFAAGVSASSGLPSMGLSSMPGASAGRGLGNGIDEAAARRCFGRASRNSSPQGACDQAADLRAAAGSGCAQASTSSATPAVTIGRLPQPRPPQGHFRLAFAALNFMTFEQR